MNKIYHLIFLLPMFLLVSCSTDRNKQINNEKIIEIRRDSDLNKADKQGSQLQRGSKFCYPTCPNSNSSTNIVVDHDDYVLNYNKTTKYADWVAYKINRSIISGKNITRTWKADPKLPIDIAMIPADYKDAALVCNYDRGHQAPLADFNNGLNWQRTNYLSNITPQKADLNRGAWYNLESKIRHLAHDVDGEMYVITGPYYTGKPMCKLPNARISNMVPNGYWKIVTLVTDKNIYRASFIFDQNIPKNANFCNYTATSSDIIKISKINLRYNDKVENSKELLDMIGCDNK